MANGKPPVILFGGDAINVLGAMRNLGRNKVQVYHVTEELSEATFSRYCKGSFIVPKIQQDMGKQRNLLKNFEKTGSTAVIFPCSDIFCLTLASLKEELGDSFHILAPRKEIAETLINKRKFYHSLEKQNIAHPITYFPESLADAQKIGQEISYPVYLRPSISQIFGQTFHTKGFVARSREELTKYYRLATRYKIDVLIQEIVSSSAVELFGINSYFDEKSNPLGIFAYHRVREWPIGFGNGSLIESVPLSSVSQIRKTLVDYLQNMGFYGLVDAEFKRDPRDYKFRLLEINPRSWWQNSLSQKCGINLILMAYMDAIGHRTGSGGDYEAGVKWIHSFNDLRSVMKMFEDQAITLPRWLSSLQKIRDWAFFSANDLFPWVLSPFFGFRSWSQMRMRQPPMVSCYEHAVGTKSTRHIEHSSANVY